MISLGSIPRKGISGSKCKYSSKAFLTAIAKFPTRKLPTKHPPPVAGKVESWLECTQKVCNKMNLRDECWFASAGGEAFYFIFKLY